MGIYSPSFTGFTNPYKFKVWRQSAQNATSSLSALLCDTTVFDTGSNVDITTNKGRFTAPVAGYYWFSARIRLVTGTNGFALVDLYKNSSSSLNGTINRSAGATTSVASHVSGIIQLAANDFVEAYIGSDTTNAITVTGSDENYFEGFLISSS